MAKKGRFRFWFILLLLLGLVGALGTRLFGVWSAGQLETTHYHLPQDVLPGAGPLRVALLSDIHDDREQLERCIAIIDKQKPDLIIFAGDLIMSGTRLFSTRRLITQLARLNAVAPTYAILGNHDYEMQQQVERILATAGVHLLRNEALDYTTPSGGLLRIVGLGTWNEGDEAPGHCLPREGKADAPVLLLSHDPESRHVLRGYHWDLMLSGHTHGGQLGVPFTHAPICFRSDMHAGHYTEHGRHHIVTRGLGSIYGMRFFCPPEVVFISIGEEK